MLAQLLCRGPPVLPEQRLDYFQAELRLDAGAWVGKTSKDMRTYPPVSLFLLEES